MKLTVYTAGIVRFVTVALASALVLSLCLPAWGSGTGIVDIKLPWDYVVEELGAGEDVSQEADERLTAVLRTVERIDLQSGAAYLRLQYSRAVFGGRDAASRVLAGLSAVPGTQAEDREQWEITVQAQNEMHRLSSACGLPQPAFQQVYADLVESVEKKGLIANRALLCRCGVKCADVAIDR